jgi:hypothetical protein
MKTEVDQALELIRQKAPTILLDTIPNIYERRIIDYIICFAIDQSNPRKFMGNYSESHDRRAGDSHNQSADR